MYAGVTTGCLLHATNRQRAEIVPLTRSPTTCDHLAPQRTITVLRWHAPTSKGSELLRILHAHANINPFLSRPASHAIQTCSAVIAQHSRTPVYERMSRPLQPYSALVQASKLLRLASEHPRSPIDRAGTHKPGIVFRTYSKRRRIACFALQIFNVILDLAFSCPLNVQFWRELRKGCPPLRLCSGGGSRRGCSCPRR